MSEEALIEKMRRVHRQVKFVTPPHLTDAEASERRERLLAAEKELRDLGCDSPTEENTG